MKRSTPLALIVVVVVAAGIAGIGGCVTVNVPKAQDTKPATTPAEKTSPAEEPVSGVGVGNRVAAVWTDGNLYLATVQAVDGDQVTVKYADDSSVKSVAASEVTPITPKAYAVGDRVLAVWSSGRFYMGSVIEASGTTYKIKWDDGSTPSDVTADKIIAQ